MLEYEFGAAMIGKFVDVEGVVKRSCQNLLGRCTWISNLWYSLALRYARYHRSSHQAAISPSTQLDQAAPSKLLCQKINWQSARGLVCTRGDRNQAVTLGNRQQCRTQVYKDFRIAIGHDSNSFNSANCDALQAYPLRSLEPDFTISCEQPDRRNRYSCYVADY